MINTHSVETLAKRKLDVRIGHRFGDLAGNSGGWTTFYGLESAQDILTGVEYGVTNSLTIGLNRTKGAGPLKQLINGMVKYRILRQKTDNSIPLSITFLGVSSVSTMSKSDDPELLNFFEKSSHRLMHTVQLLVARKFSPAFSLQLIPSYTHRNIVANNDDNGIFSVGLATRIQLTKVFGIVADATIPFSDLRTTENGFYPPLGIGLEIDTGGHIFQINFYQCARNYGNGLHSQHPIQLGRWRISSRVYHFQNVQFVDHQDFTMKQFFFSISLLAAILVLASLNNPKPEISIDENTPVWEVLEHFGEPAPNHRPNTAIEGASAEKGRDLVLKGITAKPKGGRTSKQSAHFVCTSCHNVVKEDPDLSKSDPQARLKYAEKTRDSFPTGYFSVWCGQQNLFL